MSKTIGRIVVLFLVLAALSACSRATPTPAPEFTCDTPGTIQNLTLEETSRGYSYSYALYLPPCYETMPERSYPVLYLLPGRGSGPRTWFGAGAGDVADELILSGEVPPFIITSTETTNDDMYAEAITKDLVPYIESHYRVSPDRRHHAVAGGSLGGVAAYRIVFRDPAHFSSAGMFGSGAISGEEKPIKAWLDAIPSENPVRVFFNCGEGDPLMLDQARVMMAMLDEAGIPHTEIVSDGAHVYAYWVSNMPDYFRWLAQDWE
ncbi:MAG: hypothetical protein EHM70_01485 [Chloroflexota bacterium]|nr:MAG: hypothetical protein EHM70_01485 [Chloroflexota bacterium]